MHGSMLQDVLYQLVDVYVVLGRMIQEAPFLGRLIVLVLIHRLEKKSIYIYIHD